MSWTDGAISRSSFAVADDDWQGHFVYVAWGRSRRGRPIYVGKTRRLRGRVAWHLARAPWASEVVAFDFYGFVTAQDAAVAEQEAIRDLNPKHNIIRSVPAFDGISETQRQIIARVQNRGRVA